MPVMPVTSDQNREFKRRVPLSCDNLTIPAYSHTFLFISREPSTTVADIRIVCFVSMKVKFLTYDGFQNDTVDKEAIYESSWTSMIKPKRTLLPLV